MNMAPFKFALRDSVPSNNASSDSLFYAQPQFHQMLRIERKRSERSKRPFLLLLADLSSFPGKEHLDVVENIKTNFNLCLRETDIRGWYEHNLTVGVIFTEITHMNQAIIEKILRKIRNQLHKGLGSTLSGCIRITFHVFPEDKGKFSEQGGGFNKNFYPDLTKKGIMEKVSVGCKYLIDFAGSFSALVLFSPLFLGIAAGIKLTSRGPVFFRQERLGLNGSTFNFLKFRSMYVDSDSKSHQEYIKKYIETNETHDGSGVFKMKNDPRITPFGSFLRRTSLDELPQFINVLRGEMSLVGPRPPIPYEFELYDYWHRTRLLSCKPGITGLWQIAGRSSTNFDEMVRLDLKYINEWSLWFDLKILFKTPLVVITGKGAY